MRPSIHNRKRRRHTARIRQLFLEVLERRVLLTGTGGGWPGGAVVVDQGAYDPSTILIRLAPGSCSDSACTGFPLPGDITMSSGAAVLPGLHKLQLGRTASVAGTLAELKKLPGVLYAEPNYRVRATAMPDDPRFSELWGMNNIGQTGGTIDADADLPDAWEGSTGSGSTVVAVIDTGVDYTHPDLAANMWTNSGEIPGDQIDNDGNGYVDDVHGYDFVNGDGDPYDDHRHGTHVAGTIAAVGNNGIGVTGINWNAQIMALKFLDAQGSGTVADAISAIDYAVANGATISNNSWGSNDSFSQALYDAIDRARVADHVFVAAAGNGNFLGFGQNNDTNPFYPAGFSLDNIVAVAATDHNDSRAIFSNYGATTVDLAAPGVDILSTQPGSSYGLLSGTSMASPHVTGVVALLRDTQPNWTHEQTINQLLSTVDPISSMSGISVTGGRLNAAAALQGALDPAPEIQLFSGSGLDITDDLGLVDLGITAPGFPITETFTVRNAGTLPLTLQNPITVPAGFTLVSGFGSTQLAAGTTTTFTVRMEAQNEATLSGTVSFGNDDANENPFDFTIQGQVRIPPAIQYLDDGDPGFGTAGQWTRWTGQGFDNDIHESLAGSGSEVASWTFGVLPVGTYRVAGTWTSYTNRATNAPFSIWDGDLQLAAVTVNQQLPPADFSENGATWHALGGTYAVSSGHLTVKLNDLADGRVNADAIRIERLAASPEIEVFAGASELLDGTGTLDWGTTAQGTPVDRTVTVTNIGAQPLTLSEPIQVPAGYSLVASFGATTLSTDQSTTFTVRLDANAEGTFNGVIRFNSNDDDENPFDIAATGIVDPPIAVQILDNGDTGFATSGSWTRWTGQGYQGDIHEGSPGNGSGQAGWTFSNVVAGRYRIAATWTSFTNRASDATFSIHDGATLLDTVSVNQQVPPGEFSDAGVAWDYLGSIQQIDSNRVVVTLSDQANGRLNADAIRLERMPQTPEIDVTIAGTPIVDNTGNAAFGTTSLGVPKTLTFTVTNIGQQALTLQEPINVPVGYELAASFGTTTLAADASTTFDVRLAAAALGSFGGRIAFGNNDADENPFDFSVSGTVNPPPPAIQYLDNGDASFTTNGTWTRWSGQGYGNDIHESLPGSGTGIASWSFSGLPPAAYRVAATWTAYGNRASDAPFSIWDDATSLATLNVDQRVAPNEFVDQGVGWNQLGGIYQVTSGVLRVQLSDLANGRLNADAIRIERLPDEPDIDVTAAGVTLADGVGTLDFGHTAQGVSVQRTLTVSNDGQQPLALAEPISVPSGFSLVSSFTTTNLAAGESTTFVVKMDATAQGQPSGMLSFDNNDPDENPFNFTITGTVDPPPPAVQIVDNGDAGFSAVGSWQRWQGQGYQNDIHEGIPGSGSDVAGWSFAGLLPGNYQVAATWTSYTNRASDAPFSIFDGGTLLNTATVNQQLAPNDFAGAGVMWERLGTIVTITSDRLVVQLSNAANGRLNADAIRIERTTSLSSFGPSGPRGSAPALARSAIIPPLGAGRQSSSSRSNRLGSTVPWAGPSNTSTGQRQLRTGMPDQRWAIDALEHAIWAAWLSHDGRWIASDDPLIADDPIDLIAGHLSGLSRSNE